LQLAKNQAPKDDAMAGDAMAGKAPGAGFVQAAPLK
jgi:hypothetical protein